MSIVTTTEVERASDQQLQQEVTQPTGALGPAYVVVGEILKRKQIRAGAPQKEIPRSTVKEDVARGLNAMPQAAMSAAGSWIKRGYQLFKGQQKVKKAKYVYDRAVSGDQKALKLILDLELSSVYGTDISSMDTLLKGLGNITDPINMRKGDRIVDLIGTGGPKSTEALHEVLMLVKDNASSRKIILNDLEASMTGFGT